MTTEPTPQRPDIPNRDALLDRMANFLRVFVAAADQDGMTAHSVGWSEMPYVRAALTEYERLRTMAASPASGVDLIHALRIARNYVEAANSGEHLLDGFGPRSDQPSDHVLAMIDRVLAADTAPPELIRKEGE